MLQSRYRQSVLAPNGAFYSCGLETNRKTHAVSRGPRGRTGLHGENDLVRVPDLPGK